MKQFDSRHDVRLVIPKEYRLWEEAEVHFLMEDASKNLLVNDKADYVNKETGEVVYKLKEVDTMKPGCHKAVFRINYGDGTTMSFPQKGYIEVRIERTIHNGRDTHIVEEIALKVSLIDQKFADLAEEVEEWRENVADDVKEKVYDNLDIDRISNIEVIEARGGKKDLNERITGIDEKVISHIADKKNPHGITKNDVGLGNVPNWSGATQAEARAGTNNSKIMTPQRTKESIDTFASQATIIPALSANTTGIDYPLGLTTFMHSNLGYPTNHGTIFNIKVSNLRFTQWYFPHSIRHEEIGAYFRHFYDGDGWTTWQKVETTAESIRRVNQTGWGIEQANDGAGRIDDLDAITKSGQYWFTGAAKGAPWTDNAGGTLIHLISGNMGTFANQLAFADSNNRLFMRRKTSGSWTSWQQLETSAESQTKVNTHANNKNNPHGVNSQQVNIISPRAADIPGSQYPTGVTIFAQSNGLDNGYPENLAVVVTNRVEDYRMVQTCYRANTDLNTMWIRKWRPDLPGTGWTSFTQMETVDGAQAKVNAHANDKGNPHGVTKAQVGLSNVDNAKQATKAEFDAHVNNKSNPHGVTKSQVGLGNVQNYPVASQAQAEAGTHTGSFMTPQRTKQAFQSFSSGPLNWIRASLQSTWTHSGSWPVRYAKDSTGTVYIEGSMNGGAIGGDPAIVQFTLPPGYRPGQTSYFWLVGSSSGTTGAQGLRCYLGANGNFVIQDMTWPGATQFVAVNIVFKAGN
nr:pyocin knob domain-containing protein [Shouchella tritolerans]